MSYTAGTRQFHGDFVGGKLSDLVLIRRPDAIAFPYTTAFCMGPQAIGDVSLGILNRAWRIRDDGANNVLISRADFFNTKWENEVVLFSYVGSPILELDCSFEQAGRPVVVAERTNASGQSEVWLYWFKPLISAFIFEKIADGRTPRCVLDNPKVTSDSDVLLFYISDAVDKLVYRQQRDAYGIEIATTKVGVSGLFIEDVFRASDYRVAVIMSRRDAATGTYTLERLESTLYPVPLSDLDEFSLNSLILDGELKVMLIILTLFDVDEYQVNSAIQSGTLVIIAGVITLFDIDEFQVNSAIQSGTLVVLLILHTLFDVDEFQVNSAIQSGTLVVILILHTLFDIDEFQVNSAIQSGTLV